MSSRCWCRGSTAAGATALAHRIQCALEQPILFDGQPLDVGASIGIALYPAHAADAETLVRNADIAMYVAKRSKSGYALYDPQSDTSRQQHLSLLGELRRAVEQGELRLYYQPKVALALSSVRAAEALIRWEHPTRGLVPPAQFIPFAEHTGYIKVLTRWVLEEAVRQCGEWRRAGLELQISVNISARDLMSRELPDSVAELLARYEVPAALLWLEITESGFMEDPTHAQCDPRSARGDRPAALDRRLRDRLLLAQLHHAAAGQRAEDRPLVRHADERSDKPRHHRALDHRARSQPRSQGGGRGGRGPRQVSRLLRELGCDSAQGYFISPPLPAEAFRSWLEGRLPQRSVTREAAATDPTVDGSELGVSVA